MIMESELENSLACQICGIRIGLFSTKVEVQVHMIKIHEDKNLQCLECGKFFDSTILLKLHLNRTHVDMNLQCDTCGKKFKTKLGFTKHSRSHIFMKNEMKPENDPREEEQKCFICNDTFDKYSLESHLLLHEKSAKIKEVKCNICDKVYASQDGLNTHKIFSHKQEMKHFCDLCNKSFIQKAIYIAHLEKHESIRSVKCMQCEKSFPKRSEMLRHDREVHKILRPVQCEICNMQCKSSSFLSRHLRFVHDKDEKTFQCYQCDKAYKEQGFLATHIRSVHDREVYGKCEICNKDFRTYNGLRLHKRSHEKNKENCNLCGLLTIDLSRHIRIAHSGKVKDRNYPCLECEMAFKNSSHLKRHVKAIHKPSESKLHKCNICSKEFSEAYNLKAHIDNIHEKIKNYTCSFCKKQLFSQREGKTHERLVHFGEKKERVVCSLCNKTYLSNRELRIHVKSVHENRKDYQCQFCDKAFPIASKLKRHSNVHKKVKDYKCEKCEDSFSESYKLKCHYKEAHSGVKAIIKCNLCSKEYNCQANLKHHIKVNHS